MKYHPPKLQPLGPGEGSSDVSLYITLTPTQFWTIEGVAQRLHQTPAQWVRQRVMDALDNLGNDPEAVIL